MKEEQEVIFLKPTLVNFVITKTCGDECCCAWNEIEQDNVYVGEVYIVSDVVGGSITHDSFDSLEEGVDYVSLKSYQAGQNSMK